MPVKIESIDLSFQATYPANVEEARRLAVPIALKLIQRMNEGSNLMKYLANSPASLKNVVLVIGFKESFAGALDSIIIIGSKNLVSYKKYNEVGTRLVNLHRETFDEALSIVQQGG